jgi:hypothetical protein
VHATAAANGVPVSVLLASMVRLSLLGLAEDGRIDVPAEAVL